MVATALRNTACDPGDTISRIAVAEAVEELISLQPTRAGTWRLRGLAEGYDLFGATLSAPTPELEHLRVGGVIEAAADRGDTERLIGIAEEHPDSVANLIATSNLPSVPKMLGSLLETDADRALAFARKAPEPFTGWEDFVEATLDMIRVGDLALRDPLLRLLEAWAASTTPAEASVREAIARAHAVGL